MWKVFHPDTEHALRSEELEGGHCLESSPPTIEGNLRQNPISLLG